MNTVKRITALLLCLAMALALAGCKSGAASKTEKLIAGLGEISADSRSAVEAAEAAYASLSDKDREQVENYPALQEARRALDAALRALAVEEQIQALGDITVESRPAVEAAEAALKALAPEEAALVKNADALTQARAELEAAIQEARRQALLGTWLFKWNAADDLINGMTAPLAGLGVDDIPVDHIGDILIDGHLILREDDTFFLELDREDFRKAMDDAIPGMMTTVDSMIVSLFSQEFSGLGLTVNSREDLDQILKNYLGKTLDELMKEELGSSMEDYLRNGIDEIFQGVEAQNLTQQGQFRLDPEKDVLYFTSDSGETQLDSAETFRLDGDTLVIESADGEGLFLESYPVTLTRVAG